MGPLSRPLLRPSWPRVTTSCRPGAAGRSVQPAGEEFHSHASDAKSSMLCGVYVMRFGAERATKSITESVQKSLVGSYLMDKAIRRPLGAGVFYQCGLYVA